MGEGVGVGMHQGSADAMEELLGPFPVVRLRGLPFEAQVRDVILFFQVRGAPSRRGRGLGLDDGPTRSPR